MTIARRIATISSALRIRHWSKNLLVFLPLVTGHQITNVGRVWLDVLAFVAFSFAASAGYLINDLLDLQVDRHHPVKRHRAIAAGAISRTSARAMIAGLLIMSVGLAWWTLPGIFVVTLLTYIVASIGYSLFLKSVLVVDVILLTSLYCIRIIGGGVATAAYVSAWLLGLSFFFFLSLAILKRYAELLESRAAGSAVSTRRGYLPVDADILRSAGLASGYLSVLLLALYINSEQARSLYESPFLLWLVGPLLIYWITRLWLLAHRGVVTGDAVLFASRDVMTYVVTVLTAVVLWGASVGVPLPP